MHVCVVVGIKEMKSNARRYLIIIFLFGAVGVLVGDMSSFGFG